MTNSFFPMDCTKIPVSEYMENQEPLSAWFSNEAPPVPPDLFNTFDFPYGAELYPSGVNGGFGFNCNPCGTDPWSDLISADKNSEEVNLYCSEFGSFSYNSGSAVSTPKSITPNPSKALLPSEVAHSNLEAALMNSESVSFSYSERCPSIEKKVKNLKEQRRNKTKKYYLETLSEAVHRKMPNKDRNAKRWTEWETLTSAISLIRKLEAEVSVHMHVDVNCLKPLQNKGQRPRRNKLRKL